MSSTAQNKYLRARAHSLNPVVTIGNKGITPAVVEETEVALNAHELIKIKLPAVEKSDKKNLLEALCTQTSAQRIQLIGRVGVIFRGKPDSRFSLPPAPGSDPA